MIKRIVILQDEQLVIREMSRAVRPLHAYAAAGVGAGSVLTVDEPDEIEIASEEGGEKEARELVEPTGRLADVAKAAAIKAERTAIEDTLQQVRWNRRRAAEQLGVSYKTLLNKIKECGISKK
jgi:DNA-binding NtrC family response regulator